MSVLNKSEETKQSTGLATTLLSNKIKTNVLASLAVLTPAMTTSSENESSIYDANPSDDETIGMMSNTISDSTNGMEHCSVARRSSSRCHVKKGCTCCNGSPERPKSKKLVVYKFEHNQSQQLHHHNHNDDDDEDDDDDNDNDDDDNEDDDDDDDDEDDEDNGGDDVYDEDDDDDDDDSHYQQLSHQQHQNVHGNRTISTPKVKKTPVKQQAKPVVKKR